MGPSGEYSSPGGPAGSPSSSTTNSAHVSPQAYARSVNGAYRPTTNSAPTGLTSRLAQWLGVRPGPQPVVTITLIALCVGIFIVGEFVQQVRFALVFAPVLGDIQPYRFLGSTFLHAGFWHLVFNMYALWLVGSVLEPMLGRLRFFGVYILSAFAGNVAVLLTSDQFSQSWNTATVGASGAVFGVFGALFVLMRQFDANARSLLVVIVANLALGFIPGMNISWESHVGGLVVGGALMALMLAGRAQNSVTVRRVRDVALFALTTAALVGLVFWGYR
ncbi:rhomboid family intramembrane serine protease [Arcanobacterium haemolyticum]|nr:rhomboid family intramembrane serine protease [Arcanobacterium haemolyticum]